MYTFLYSTLENLTQNWGVKREKERNRGQINNLMLVILSIERQ